MSLAQCLVSRTRSRCRRVAYYVCSLRGYLLVCSDWIVRASPWSSSARRRTHQTLASRHCHAPLRVLTWEDKWLLRPFRIRESFATDCHTLSNVTLFSLELLLGIYSASKNGLCPHMDFGPSKRCSKGINDCRAPLPPSFAVQSEPPCSHLLSVPRPALVFLVELSLTFCHLILFA